MLIPIVIGALGNLPPTPPRIGKGTGRLENMKTSRDHPDYSIIKISQNTEKSPGDFEELRQMGERTRKLMTMHKALYWKDHI